MATLKIDGLFFVGGLALGMTAFGETIDRYRAFWDTSGNYGDITLPEVFGLPSGLIVLGVVIMALGMFGAAEMTERFFASRKSNGETS